MDTNTALTETEEIIAGDNLMASTDGADGDPDQLGDDLNAHGTNLQELSGLTGSLEDADCSLDDLLVRMIPWLWLF